MGKKLETKLKAVYPILEEGLRKLGLSTYEIVCYATLLNIRKPVEKKQILEESKKFGGIPSSKIYATLSSLERKKLIIKRAGYPRLYEIDTGRRRFEELIEQRVNELEKKKKELEGYLKNKLDEVWSNCILKSEGIWEIEESKAIDVTRDMWQRAEEEIMLMTKSGDWIPETKDLMRILDEKSSNPNFRIYVLILRPELVKQSKRKKYQEFETFLKRINANVYHYVPGTFRMNIVDKRESLLFIYEYKKPYIYYTPISEVSRSLAHLFVLQCLATDEYNSILKEVSQKVDKSLQKAIKDLYF